MIGAIAAGAAAAGILLLISVAARPGPAFADRVLPYTDAGWRPSRPSRLSAAVALLLKALETAGSSSASVAKRAEALGTTTLRDFRMRQLRWAALGFGLGVALSYAGFMAGAPPAILLLMPLLGPAVGALGADWLLTRSVRQRARSMTAELPDLAELLALSVGAGESIRAALERVASIGSGALAAEIGRTLDAVRAGDPLAGALGDMAARCDNLSVGRFVDAIVTSLERGTSLGDVLRAQAADAREQARRELLEEGGRKEIGMLIPVVFLIMPLTIVFTLYPSFATLTLTP